MNCIKVNSGTKDTVSYSSVSLPLLPKHTHTSNEKEKQDVLMYIIE